MEASQGQIWDTLQQTSMLYIATYLAPNTEAWRLPDLYLSEIKVSLRN